MNTFKVGEIAIVQNAAPWFAHLNETECEVLAVCMPPIDVGNGQFQHYAIRCADGRAYGADKRNLRKKRPPTEYAGEKRVREMFTKPPVVRPEPECV